MTTQCPELYAASSIPWEQQEIRFMMKLEEVNRERNKWRKTEVEKRK
jgi:hypothetical protein